MDEIFGIENNQVTLFVQVRYGQKTLSEKNYYQKLIEHIHVYSKGKFLPNRDKVKYTIDKFEWEIKEFSKGTKIKLGKRDSLKLKAEREID